MRWTDCFGYAPPPAGDTVTFGGSGFVARVS